jgi:hypothetical protein
LRPRFNLLPKKREKVKVTKALKGGETIPETKEK